LPMMARNPARTASAWSASPRQRPSPFAEFSHILRAAKCFHLA
jgi:hypothetical protein